MSTEKRTLREVEVRKNVFGLLSIYIFMATFILINILKFITKIIPIPHTLLLVIGFIGYGCSIISEIIYLYRNKKIKDIDLRASGSELGFAGMTFSILMILFEIAGNVGI